MFLFQIRFRQIVFRLVFPMNASGIVGRTNQEFLEKFGHFGARGANETFGL